MEDKKNWRIYIIFALLFLVLNTSGCNKRKNQFLDALLANDWKTAQVILDKSPELVHLRVKSGGTLLHSAVYYDNAEMLKFLIENGANVNARAKRNNETPLHDAAIQNRYNMASILLENEADVNARDELQCTPLHKAAMYSDKMLVELLLSHGAEADAKRDYFDRTPLYYACVNRKEDQDALEVIEALLLNGADPNAKCFTDHSIIQATVVYPNWYFKKAQLLEDFGAKLEVKTDDGTQIIKVKEFQQICQENEQYIKQNYEQLNQDHLDTKVKR